MNILPKFTLMPGGDLRRGRKILSRFQHNLKLEYADLLDTFDLFGHQPAVIESLNPLLATLAGLRQEARLLLARFDEERLAETYERLVAQRREIGLRLQAAPVEAREATRRLLHLITFVDDAIGELQPLQQNAQHDRDESPNRVLVPTDLLYQCQYNLFPAERMMVVAGRRRGRQIFLGAVFDVTGAASAGHVRADPRKLGHALIAMSATGAHLAAWFHSHPGSGPYSTGPSSTDLKQHSDWLRDYSPRLLSGIFVHDRYLRFWGSGLDDGKIRPVLLGAGIDEHKGDESHVYRINPG